MGIKLTQFRLAKEIEMRKRIKQRVIEAQRRANPCDCPLCTLKRQGVAVATIGSLSQLFGLLGEPGVPEAPAPSDDVRH